ncbi:hypothetical protein ACB094_11G150700 [Castanea mollissima]
MRLCMGLFQLNSAPPPSQTSSFRMCVLIVLCWYGILITSVVGCNNETDRLALLKFKAKITQDPLMVMSSWNHSIHFCQWGVVTCGRQHQRVTVLDLQSSKLVTLVWQDCFLMIPENVLLINQAPLE